MLINSKISDNKLDDNCIMELAKCFANFKYLLNLNLNLRLIDFI